MRAGSRIGTAKENSLHSSLKLQYAGSGGLVEAAVGQYVCDAIREDGELVEIQTGNFGSIKEKIASLAQNAPVRLIHPIACIRTIELVDLDGSLIRRRKSPRKGSPWDVFSHLIRAPYFPLLRGLTIELILVEETEIRVNDGAGSWRRKGVSIADRRLDAVRDTIVLRNAQDYRRFIPTDLPAEFNSTEFARAAGIRPDSARKALYVLKRIGLVVEVGKKGNSRIYRSNA
jgi:hypothetical protein